MEKIKIAFFIGRYDSFYGAQKSMYTLITNLDRGRINPVVVTTAGGEISSRFKEAGVEVRIIPLSAVVNTFGGKITGYSFMKKSRLVMEIISYNFRLYKWLKQEGIDLVYTNGIRALTYASLPAKLLGIPVVRYIRGDQNPASSLNPLLRRFYKYLELKVPAKIITIADGVRRIYSDRELQHFADKFVTLYTGFDLKRYIESVTDKSSTVDNGLNSIKSKFNIPDNVRVIGMVASIIPRKGHELLIEAANQVRSSSQDIHYLMVGAASHGYDEYYTSLKEKVAEYGLTEKFHWVGYQEDVLTFYRVMDLLVLPSSSEGLPRVVIEGLAAGLPVVATDAGGTDEIIISDEYGLVVEQGDSSQLAEAVQVMLDDRYQTGELYQKRSDYVKSKFSIPEYVNGFTEIIEDIVGNPNKS